MTLTNQQFRKRFHKELVRRSKEPGHPTIGQPGSTKRWASKLAAKPSLSAKQRSHMSSD